LPNWKVPPKADKKYAYLSYWITGFVTLEDGTDSLSRNVGETLPLISA